MGKVTTTVVCNHDGARQVILDAISFQDVHVTAGDSLQYDYDGKLITITWEKPFTKGEKRDVIVEYVVEKPVTGLTFGGPDEHYPDRAAYAAADNETERARYWLPCMDFPTVRTTLEFVLTARKEYGLLANGVLVSEVENEDGTKTANWVLDFPCPSYLVCVVCGELVEVVDETARLQAGEVPVRYYGVKGDAPEDLMFTFGGTPKLLAWLEKRGTPGVPMQSVPHAIQWATRSHSRSTINSLSPPSAVPWRTSHSCR